MAEMTLDQQRAVAMARARLRLQDKAAAQNESEAPIPEADRMSPWRFLTGAAEAAAAIGSGALATPVAGIRGLYSTVKDAVTRTDNVNARAVDVIKNTQSGLTYEPRGQTGKDVLEKLAAPMEWYNKNVSQRAGRAVADAPMVPTPLMPTPGGPIAGMATEVALDFLPTMLGLKNAPKGAADIVRVNREAKAAGVPLGGGLEKIEKRFSAEAEKQAGGNRPLGQNMPALQEAVAEKKAIEKSYVDDLYEAARSESAGLPARVAKQFPEIAKSALGGFDIKTMPIVRRRLAELDQLSKLPDGSAVKLNSIEAFRQRLNKNRPATTDLSQTEAIGRLRTTLDEFMEAQFNADMISGSPQAIAKWKGARAANERYRSLFSDDKLIRQIQSKGATPEEMRAWIFGTSAVGMRAEAARTVGKIKKILGEDHPQFNALRQEALLDIMQPLMKDKPDFNGFMDNYDRLVRKNPTVAGELFPESMPALRALRGLAGSVEKAEPTRRLIDLDRIGATALFGHGIAKAGLKVNLAKKLFGALRMGGNKSVKRQIVSDVLGYDPYSAVVPKKAALQGGAYVGVTSQDKEQGDGN